MTATGAFGPAAREAGAAARGVGDGVEDVGDGAEGADDGAGGEAVGEVADDSANVEDGASDTGPDAVTCGGGTRSTVNPHITAAPSNPPVRAAAASREWACGLTRRGALVMGAVAIAGV